MPVLWTFYSNGPLISTRRARKILSRRLLLFGIVRHKKQIEQGILSLMSHKSNKGVGLGLGLELSDLLDVSLGIVGGGGIDTGWMAAEL